jgi:hypothetical protein
MMGLKSPTTGTDAIVPRTSEEQTRMNATTTALEKKSDRQKSTASEVVDAGFGVARFGQEASLAAAREFVELADKVLPVQGGEDSLRRGLIDGAFQFADQVSAAQLSAVRSVIHRPHMPGLNLALQAFTFEDVKVNVGVSVPTDVGAFNTKHVS